MGTSVSPWLEEIGIRLAREDTIAQMRKAAEDMRRLKEATLKERNDERAAKERSMAAHDDTLKELAEARAVIEDLREQKETQRENTLELERNLTQKTVQLESEGMRQGLTLVHFSAQPEPLLTQNTPQTPPNTP
jgi:beta-phosphoglucomutase-like phosphatase (HAD superfamily)